MDRGELDIHIAAAYGVAAEYPWLTAPTFGVYRHGDNRKWFAVIMELSATLFGLPEGRVDVVNLKCDPLLIGSLLGEEGIHPGYHMNKGHWITVRLDGSVPPDRLCWLLDMSFRLTEQKRRTP